MISYEEGKALAESWNAAFLESSAKENQVRVFEAEFLLCSHQLREDVPGLVASVVTSGGITPVEFSVSHHCQQAVGCFKKILMFL